MTSNQLWKKYKQSGGDLSYKEWRYSQQAKPVQYNATGPQDRPIADSLNKSIDDLHRQAGYRDTLSKDYILGIPRNVVVIGGVIIMIGIASYLIYQHTSKVK